ncbi:hypothetical protein KXR15_003519 [Escherichia coli]|nr:hypothetical protein [Escherichia coli]
MPRNIPINTSQQPLLGGVLIKRNTLEKKLSLGRLEQQARKRAKQLIKDAQKEAQVLHEQAHRDGFQQGILYALKQVVTYLSDSNLTLEYWQQCLEKQVREMLATSVNHPETLLLVFDEWMSRDINSDVTVSIIFPEAMKTGYSEVISRIIEDREAGIDIRYHTGSNIIFRCGGYIAEFSPVEFTEAGTRRILMKNIPRVNQDCHCLSRDALILFIEYCQNLINKPEHHDAVK